MKTLKLRKTKKNCSTGSEVGEAEGEVWVAMRWC